MTPIGRVTPGVGYDTEELLDEIKLVGCHIVEISTSCYLGLYPPRQTGWIQILFSRGSGIPHLHILYLANHLILYDLLDFDEIRQIPPIVSHKTWDTRLSRHTSDSRTVIIARGEWFLYIDRFAGRGLHDCITGVAGGGRGGIYGIDLRVVRRC